ncbi:MAG TPA: twin-arginine translocation signal domain-containing protein, partial [Bryobacteraceae bacterium]|nr:twin-arginine translocation signal domain-containing protein [Bryobacteraceae bacterium]
MQLSRRSFLYAAGAGLAMAAKRFEGFHVGVTDWNLQLAGKLEAVELAKRLGFDGVQVSLGRKPADGRLPLDNAEIQA